MSEQCQYSQVLESKNRELLTEIASLSKTNQQMRREVEDK